VPGAHHGRSFSWGRLGSLFLEQMAQYRRPWFSAFGWILADAWVTCGWPVKVLCGSGLWRPWLQPLSEALLEQRNEWELASWVCVSNVIILLQHGAQAPSFCKGNQTMSVSQGWLTGSFRTEYSWRTTLAFWRKNCWGIIRATFRQAALQYDWLRSKDSSFLCWSVWIIIVLLLTMLLTFWKKMAEIGAWDKRTLDCENTVRK
jgi:hypothetical protein